MTLLLFIYFVLFFIAAINSATAFVWSECTKIVATVVIRAREIVGFAGSGPIFES